MAESFAITPPGRGLSDELKQTEPPPALAKTRIGSRSYWLAFLQDHDWSSSDGWDCSPADASWDMAATSASGTFIDLSLPAAVCDQIRNKLLERVVLHEWTPWNSAEWGFRPRESDTVRGIWRKSSYQIGPGGADVAALGVNVVAIRNASKPLDVARFTRDEWHALVEGMKAGEFDLDLERAA